MNDTDFLPPWFRDFLKGDVDRAAFLADVLVREGFSPKIVELRGRRHVFLRLPGEGGNPAAFVAHHDRVLWTEGANDNSAACAILFNLAIARRKRPGRPLLIVFSDGEEYSSRAADQGAFSLALALAKSDFADADCYVTDGVGVGDSVILSTSAISMFRTEGSRDSRLCARVRSLHDRTRTTFDAHVPGRWRELPTPHSDEAGLVAGGFPAVTLSVLPAAEAEALARRARLIPDLFCDHGYHEGGADRRVGDAVPATWRRFHTEGDRLETLEPGAFALALRAFLALSAV